MSNQEQYPTPEHVMARAKELKRAGYVVLVATCPKGHWTGYSAFHMARPTETPIAVLCDVPMTGDPQAIYELDA